MGISADFGFYDGSCQQFNNARDDISIQCGRGSIRDYQCFDGHKKWILNGDDVEILLDLVDADGVIPYPKCLPLAKRLSEIMKSLDAETLKAWNDSGTYTIVQNFISGLHRAHKSKQDIEYS